MLTIFIFDNYQSLLRLRSDALHNDHRSQKAVCRSVFMRACPSFVIVNDF